MDKIHAREAFLKKKRQKKLKRIERESREIMRKYAKSTNIVE